MSDEFLRHFLAISLHLFEILSSGARFKIFDESFVFMIFYVLRSLYMRDINPLSDVYLAKILLFSGLSLH